MSSSSSTLRLPSGRVTVLLGSARMRAAVLARLEDSARCGGGHDAAVVRVTEPVPASPLPLVEVLAALADVPAAEADLRTATAFPALAPHLAVPTEHLAPATRSEAALAVALLRGAAAVVVDRLESGSDRPTGTDRTALGVLAATGAAVLVDAADPVAALAAADAALRVGEDGSLSLEDLLLPA